MVLIYFTCDFSLTILKRNKKNSWLGSALLHILVSITKPFNTALTTRKFYENWGFSYRPIVLSDRTLCN